MDGIGAMIHMIGDGSEHSPSEYVGQTILSAELLKEQKLSRWEYCSETADCVRLRLSGGKSISIWDAGRSCCESRYITTDDDISALVGGCLNGITAKDGPTEGDDGYQHETCFVEITTDKGFITLTTHNEHNGYYGGFGLTITEDKL